ncbi:MAG TPA: VOC family protein [Flavisolibacter sp.]|nr:VOC family protein [Flavisolibacter sp.]
MSNKQKIVTSLWFGNNAEEAVNFYISVFPDSRIKQVSRFGPGGHMPEGSLLSASFELNGVEFMALNGAPAGFSETASLMVSCDSQEEIDAYWQKLSTGGEEGQCGWLKDKFGLSWQIVPSMLGEMMSGGDTARTSRVVNAFLQMKKFDIRALEAAYGA